MIHRVEIAAPNSLLLLMDPATDSIPESMDQELVASTESCIAIGTLSPADGKTVVWVSNEALDLPTGRMAFDGTLACPSQCISLRTVLNDDLFTVELPTCVCYVRVFANHAVEPNEIWIIVGDHKENTR